MNNNNSKLHIKNIIFILILLAGDIAAYFVSLILAYNTRILTDSFMSAAPFAFLLEYLATGLWWIPVIFILMLAYRNLYTLKKPFWHESRRLLLSCFMTFLVVFSIVSLGKLSNFVSRLFLIFLFVYLMIFVTLFRYILKTKVLNRKFFAENIVIIGYSNYLDHVKHSILHENGLCFYAAGVVLTDNCKYTGSQKILGHISDIESIIKKYNITSAVVIKNEVDKSFEKILNNLQANLWV